MGAIKVLTNTKATATLKLYNQFTSYLFEQECDELRRYATQADIKAIKAAQKALNNIIEKGKK